MGFFQRVLRRLGYVRLRDYNLRVTVQGLLVPIDSTYPVPFDVGARLPFAQNALAPPPTQPQIRTPSQPWPQIPRISPPPIPSAALAEGTADGLEAVARSPQPDFSRTEPLAAIPDERSEFSSPYFPFSDDERE